MTRKLPSLSAPRSVKRTVPSSDSLLRLLEAMASNGLSSLAPVALQSLSEFFTGKDGEVSAQPIPDQLRGAGRRGGIVEPVDGDAFFSPLAA